MPQRIAVSAPPSVPVSADQATPSARPGTPAPDDSREGLIDDHVPRSAITVRRRALGPRWRGRRQPRRAACHRARARLSRVPASPPPWTTWAAREHGRSSASVKAWSLRWSATQPIAGRPAPQRRRARRTSCLDRRGRSQDARWVSSWRQPTVMPKPIAGRRASRMARSVQPTSLFAQERRVAQEGGERQDHPAAALTQRGARSPMRVRAPVRHDLDGVRERT